MSVNVAPATNLSCHASIGEHGTWCVRMRHTHADVEVISQGGVADG